MSKLKFNPVATEYDANNALILAEASELAYENNDIVKQTVTVEWQFENLEFVNSGGVQAFIAANDETILVVFRGTDEVADWGINLDAKMVESSFGKIHQGFKVALDLVKGNIVSTISKFRINNHSLWITGHSLGGALAMVLAAELIEEKCLVQGLYTYGQPPVGDRDFVEKFNAQLKNQIFRFVNNNDGVPNISAIKRLGYKHAGQFLYFGVLGKLYIEPPRWFLCVHGIVGFVLNISEWILNKKASIKTFESYADHAMKWYLANLRNLETTAGNS